MCCIQKIANNMHNRVTLVCEWELKTKDDISPDVQSIAVRMRRLYASHTPVARPVSRLSAIRTRIRSAGRATLRLYRQSQQRGYDAVTWPPAATNGGMAIITTTTPTSPRRTRFVAHLFTLCVNWVGCRDSELRMPWFVLFLNVQVAKVETLLYET